MRLQAAVLEEMGGMGVLSVPRPAPDLRQEEIRKPTNPAHLKEENVGQ